QLDTAMPAWLSVCVAVGPKESLPRLLSTLDSATSQVDRRAEIVVKVAGSHLAGEIEEYRNAHPGVPMRVLTGPDSGIYDAFNICAASATGKYALFLGCGDQLADPN